MSLTTDSDIAINFHDCEIRKLPSYSATHESPGTIPSTSFRSSATYSLRIPPGIEVYMMSNIPDDLKMEVGNLLHDRDSWRGVVWDYAHRMPTLTTEENLQPCLGESWLLRSKVDDDTGDGVAHLVQWTKSPQSEKLVSMQSQYHADFDEDGEKRWTWEDGTVQTLPDPFFSSGSFVELEPAETLLWSTSITAPYKIKFLGVHTNGNEPTSTAETPGRVLVVLEDARAAGVAAGCL